MFVYKSLMRIEFFKEIDFKMFHEILYKMKTKYFECGSMLLKEGDDTDAFFIVEYGELEIFTEFEGNEFVIDRLPPGSVLNHHVVFTEDNMIVNIRASKNTYINTLTEDDLESLASLNADFHKKKMMYVNNLYR